MGNETDPERDATISRAGPVRGSPEPAPAPPGRAEPTAAGTEARRDPERIGDYRILGRLGAGGMGVVYEAEQLHPQRRVALKVIRGGHLVDEVHARMFQREAETLGRLKHPGIAAIYESGHTDEGQDYFAMELVDGPTLDRWLRSRPGRLDSDELRLRLRLFLGIADAVHYAHQRGVIHRDLKPTNVIVARHPGTAAGNGAPSGEGVKVLDFGLARVTDREDHGLSAMTQVGVIKGTLSYMAPEQARGDSAAIDIRADVYALGVILYELLTGSRPYDLEGASLVEAVRLICEQPPKPLCKRSPAARNLDSDLEVITSTAIAKDPEQRYGSAAALAEDVERYLSSQPIRARRPSASYRVRKFMGRHRAGAAAAGLVLIAVVLGAVGATVGLLQTRRAEALARAEAATSLRVSQFLADILARVDPREVGQTLVDDLEERVAQGAVARGAGTAEAEEAAATFRQLMLGVSATDAGRRLIDQTMLRRAARTIDDRFGQDPEVAGRLEQTLAETYQRLGLYDRALHHARRAVSIRSGALGDGHAGTLASQTLVGTLLYHQGLYDEARLLLAETRSAQTATLGGHHPDTLQTGVRLSWVDLEQGRPRDAERLLREILPHQREALGAEHRDTITTMNALAVALTDQERFAEAEALHSEILSIRSAVLGPSDPDTLKSMTNLAVLTFHQGRLDSAEALFREVLEIQRTELGPEHPTTLGSANNVAVVLERQHKLEEAEAVHRQVLSVKRRSLGPEHPETLSSMHNLAIVHTSRGLLAEAERLHRETLEMRRRVLGAGSPPALESLCALAGVAALRGERSVALARLSEAIDLGYDRSDTLAADSDFASLRDDPEFLALLERGGAR